jgi:uncharacterized membrane protein YkvA (DUF1232 family)
MEPFDIPRNKSLGAHAQARGSCDLSCRSEPTRALYTKYLALAVAGYALSPIDLIPDFIPVLRYVDDLIIVPLGIWLVLSLIPEDVMTACRARADEAVAGPHGRIAAIVIIAIWIVGAAMLGWIGFVYWRGTN